VSGSWRGSTLSLSGRNEIQPTNLCLRSRLQGQVLRGLELLPPQRHRTRGVRQIQPQIRKQQFQRFEITLKFSLSLSLSLCYVSFFYLSLYFLSHFLFLLTLHYVFLSFLLFFTITLPPTLLPISEFVCTFEYKYLFHFVLSA